MYSLPPFVLFIVLASSIDIILNSYADSRFIFDIFNSSRAILIFGIVSYPLGFLPFHPFVDAYSKFPRISGLVGEPSHMAVPLAVFLCYVLSFRQYRFQNIAIALIIFVFTFSPSTLLAFIFSCILFSLRFFCRSFIIPLFLRLKFQPPRLVLILMSFFILSIFLFYAFSSNIISEISSNIATVLQTGRFIDPRAAIYQNFVASIDFSSYYLGFGFLSDVFVSNTFNSGRLISFSSLTSLILWFGNNLSLVILFVVMILSLMFAIRFLTSSNLSSHSLFCYSSTLSLLMISIWDFTFYYFFLYLVVFILASSKLSKIPASLAQVSLIK